MKKLIGILSVVLIICGFTLQVKAESTVTPCGRVSYYHYFYFDDNIAIERYNHPSMVMDDVYVAKEDASGTFYNEFEKLGLMLRYDAASRYPESEYVYINLMNALASTPTVSGYYDPAGVFFDVWEMSFKGNYNIMIPYLYWPDPDDNYEISYYPETIGIEGTVSMNSQGYVTISYSVSEPFDFSNPTPTPIPAAVLLLGSGLSGLAALRHRLI